MLRRLDPRPKKLHTPLQQPRKEGADQRVTGRRASGPALLDHHGGRDITWPEHSQSITHSPDYLIRVTWPVMSLGRLGAGFCLYKGEL